MYNCDRQDWWLSRHQSQWSDKHSASKTENVWPKGRISTGGELKVLTMAAVKTNPEVQGRPVVAHDHFLFERAHDFSVSRAFLVLCCPSVYNPVLLFHTCSHGACWRWNRRADIAFASHFFESWFS